MADPGARREESAAFEERLKALGEEGEAGEGSEGPPGLRLTWRNPSGISRKGMLYGP